MLVSGNSRGRMLIVNEFIPKPDTGTLFINGYKTTSKQPHYVGTYATEDGTVREFAAWINEPTGRLSVKFQDKYEKPVA